MLITVQVYEYTKNHWAGYFKFRNYLLELYINKDVRNYVT